jgi:hypothetical protein
MDIHQPTMTIPQADGSRAALLEQLRLILGEAHWRADYSEDGELIIRTGLTDDMDGMLYPIDDDDE